jgi:hypothetical protein
MPVPSKPNLVENFTSWGRGLLHNSVTFTESSDEIGHVQSGMAIDM